MVSCKSDKQAKLQQLKQEYEKTGENIKSLEKELNIKDTTSLNSQKVQYLVVKPDTFCTSIEVQGNIDGEENVVATSKTVGVVTQVFVKEGDSVKKGQILAQMDAGVIEQTLKELQTSYDFLNDLYVKQKKLWDQKIGSEVQFLSAKNNKDGLEMRIKTMKEQLDMYKIASPIDGTIEEVDVKVGQSLAPGLTVFRIVNFSKVKVVADISESYSGTIRKGDKVIIHFPNDNIDLNSTISFSSRYINPANRYFRVESYINSHPIEFRANMVATLNIINYTNPKAIIMPVNIVLEDKNEPYVFIAKEENGVFHVEKTTVKTGKNFNARVEILSGLKPGDKVISSNLFNLRNGDVVNL
jgi:RND family efflux transporter MFP subunit